MEAGLDKYWLDGDPSWWPRNESSHPPKMFDYETKPSEEWFGWRRQRMQPTAARFVYAPAWSLALLIASTFPLLAPGNTPDDQTSASLLFFGSFILLLLPPTRIASAMPDGDGLDMFRWLWLGGGMKNMSRTLGLAVFGGLTFVAHIIIDVRIGWISYALFLCLWYHLMCRAGNSLIPNSGRWLAPLGGQNDAFTVSDDWTVVCKRFRGGRLAYKELNAGRRLELHGVNRRGEKFLAIHLRHPSSLLYDPFVEDSRSKMGSLGLGWTGVRVQLDDDELSKPPVDFEMGAWPVAYVGGDEEE